MVSCRIIRKCNRFSNTIITVLRYAIYIIRNVVCHIFSFLSNIQSSYVWNRISILRYIYTYFTLNYYFFVYFFDHYQLILLSFHAILQATLIFHFYHPKYHLLNFGNTHGPSLGKTIHQCIFILRARRTEELHAFRQAKIGFRNLSRNFAPIKAKLRQLV